jgi:hypothetical protein
MTDHCIVPLTIAAAYGEYTEGVRVKIRETLDTHPAVSEMFGQDITTLRDALKNDDDEELREKLYILLADYLNDWTILGMPRSHEEWEMCNAINT